MIQLPAYRYSERSDNSKVAAEQDPVSEHVFRLLESNGLITYAESIGGGLHMDVFWVSPELKRKLEQC
jgi:hypothetical protein